MAKPNVFVLSILVIASLFSISHSLNLFGFTIDQVRIRGVLRCTQTGDLNAPPVSNATVKFVCAGSDASLAETVTDPVGGFLFVFNALETTLVNPSDCFIEANLPTGTCQIYPPDGTVQASVVLVSLTVTSLFKVASYAVTAFFNPNIN